MPYTGDSEGQAIYNHREKWWAKPSDGGPSIINLIYILHSGYLLGIFLLKGSNRGFKHPDILSCVILPWILARGSDGTPN